MPHRALGSVLPEHEMFELYRLMVEDIKETAVFLMNPDGIITVWNKGAEEMKGYTAAEAIGQHLRVLYTEEDRARGHPEHNLREAARHGYYSEETWRQRKDGTLFWAHIALTALRSRDDDTLLGFSKITLDLTRHKLLEQCEREKQEIDLVLRAAESGTWKWEQAHDRIEVSQQLLHLLGYDGRQRTLDQGSWLQYIHPEDLEGFARQFEAVRARPGAAALETELRLRRADGGHQWFFLRANWTSGAAQDSARTLLGVCVAIDNLKRAEQRAAAEKERALVTLAAITDGVVTTDRAGRLTSMNPAAERLLGLADAIARSLAERRVVTGLPTLTLRAGGDERYAVENAVAPIVLKDGALIGTVLVFHDVTESRRLMRRLGFEASHDALTGLVNRREFETRLQRTLERIAHPGSEGAALLYMDLDQFKVVNDTCGHSAGDDLLRQLAGSYLEHVRERDTLARIGGDEFALIVQHCTIDEALTVAHKMLEATRNFRYACKGRMFQLGVSVGVTPIDRSTSSVEDALRQADHACYIAKERGRNRVYVHYQGDRDFAQRRSDMHWVTRLTHAFENDQLQLYRQPIMALAPGAGRAPRHYEILLRLRNGKSGPICPGVFLPAAERYDVILKIDRWVLARTLAWMAANPAASDQLEMFSINLSRRSLADQSFHRYAAELIDASQVPASKLCFEITENGAIADMGKTIAFIEALAARGCRFSLDDFGSGMTSFSYLKQLPVDYIKIDGAFIQMMASSQVDFEMVRFTNDISHMMGRKTIAEYVSDPAMVDKLKAIGVDFAQGFYVGRPRPLAA